jgi:hypothetical protein
MNNQEGYKNKYRKMKQTYLLQKNKMSGGSSVLVENAWRMIIKISSHLRSKLSDFDGLGYWMHIKPILVEVDNRDHDKIIWNPEHNKIVKAFKKQSIAERIPESIDGKLVEKNHFLWQQVNIPTKDDSKTSFRRLMQIALNIGQFIAHKEEFDKDILEMIRKFDMTEISTYMTEDDYTKYHFEDKEFLKLEKILEELVKNPPTLKNAVIE